MYYTTVCQETLGAWLQGRILLFFFICRLLKVSDFVPEVYENIALDFVENPHQMIDVENFGDGEKRHMATLSLNNPTTGVESSSTSTVYIGDFAQATSPMFDMKCFPFDRKQTLFRITLQRLGLLQNEG